MAIEKVIEDLTKIKDVPQNKIYNKIVSTFDNYDVDGKKEVIVSSGREINTTFMSENTYIAYISNSKSSTIMFSIQEKNGLFSVDDAW